MCVRVGIHVCVLGWAFMCVCVRVGVHMCVLGWAFMYDRDIDFASVSTICY
jgi:hypothetical protein